MSSNLRGRLGRLEQGAVRSPAIEELTDRLLVQLNTPGENGLTPADELREQFEDVTLFPGATPKYRAVSHLFAPVFIPTTPEGA